MFYSSFLVFAQEKTDSSSSETENKWRIAVYFSPTTSFNMGKKRIPPYYYGPDYNPSQGYLVYTSYNYKSFNHREHRQLGYNFGFDIVSPNFLNKVVSLSAGFKFESFYYTGVADCERTTWEIWTLVPDSSKILKVDTLKDYYNYYFMDRFITLPLSLNICFFQNEKQKILIQAGSSIGFFFEEKNSNLLEYNEYKGGSTSSRSSGVNPKFGTIGIAYFRKLGKKEKSPSVTFAPNFTFEWDTSPRGRKLASTGIRFGILF